jgi:hypothetical protein
MSIPVRGTLRRKWGTDQVSRAAKTNLSQIRKTGLDVWLEEQRERRLMVEELLANYNEGRSMSFYCLACTLMPVELIKEALTEIRTMPVNDFDVKAKAKALKSTMQELALKSSFELWLRRKPE